MNLQVKREARKSTLGSVKYGQCFLFPGDRTIHMRLTNDPLVHAVVVVRYVELRTGVVYLSADTREVVPLTDDELTIGDPS